MESHTNIQSIRKVEEIWYVESETMTYTAPKVMIASGLCSVPKMPLLLGQYTFGGTIVHTEGFGETKIMEDSKITKIVVLGAGKSAADVVYDAVKHAKEVHWVIRTTDTGPSFFASGKARGPYKNAFEAAHTRTVASLGPSIFNGANLWTRFLQQTRLGRWIVGKLLAKQDQNIRNEANYHGRDSTKGFDQLEYQTPYVQ